MINRKLGFKKTMIFVTAMFLLTMIVIMVIRCVLPMYLIIRSDEILKDTLNNFYIDNGYAGWRQIQIQGIGSFQIPLDWSLEQQNNNVTIHDGNSNQVAVGFVYLSENGRWSSMTDQALCASMATHVGFMPSSVEYSNVIDFLSFNGCEMIQISFRDESCAVDHYCLKLRSAHNDELWLLFTPKDYLNYYDLVNITEAIAYSYVFPK